MEHPGRTAAASMIVAAALVSATLVASVGPTSSRAPGEQPRRSSRPSKRGIGVPPPLPPPGTPEGDSLTTAHAIDAYLATAYQVLGSWKNPGLRALAERTYAIREKELEDRDDPDWVPALITVAQARLGAGAPTDAKRILDRALAIADARLRPDSPLLLAILDDLDVIEWSWGSFAQSVALKKRALAVVALEGGPNDGRMAERTYEVGRAAFKAGDYAMARRYLNESMRMMEARGAASTGAYADALNSIGLVEATEGRFDQGVRDLRAALDLRERLFGPLASDTGQSLNNLGWLCSLYGDAACAVDMFRKTIGVWSAARGPDDGDTAMAHLNLGEALRDEGRLAEAAVEVRAGARLLLPPVRPNHSYRWLATAALGRVDLDEGKLDEAARTLSEAWELARVRFSGDAPELAEILESEAEVAEARGKLGEALSDARLRLAMCERLLGDRHPEVGNALARVARIEGRSGDVSAAVADALHAAGIQRAHLRLTARALPETKALSYAATSRKSLDVLLSLGFPESRTIGTDRLWDEVIRSRAVTLEELALRRHVLSADTDGETRTLRERLDATRSALAARVLLGPEAGRGDAYRRELDGAREAEERAADALARKSAEFLRRRTLDEAGYEAVAAALPPDSALVAYVRFGDPVRHYGAFVLGGAGEGARRIDLGPATTIDDAVRAWREEVSGPPEARRSLRGGAEERYRAAAGRLRDLVWSPVAALLDRPDGVFLVPSGLLAFVSFATLPSGAGGYLVDRGPTFHYLSAERDLTRRPDGAAAEGGLLAIGGVDFGTVRPTVLPAPLDPLPFASSEVHAIAADFQQRRRTPVLVFEGRDATEKAFRSFAGRFSIVHVATHGFFLKSIPGAPGPGLDRAAENPLYRAGLVFTAPRADAPGAASGANDGLLTAAEVASLDLSRTSWVVLSACDTGLGDLQSGEGVIGLRRAFEIAGARTVLMSLWHVDDGAAGAWMQALYAARLGGASTRGAVRSASRAYLQRCRDTGRTTHPYAWGAFVAAGDWR